MRWLASPFAARDCSTRRLPVDGKRDTIRRMIAWSRLLDLAEREVARTLARLPSNIRGKVQRVPVLIERRPAAEDIAAGIEDDTLGIFEGAAHGEPDELLPPRIRLWVENLWEFAEEDQQAFREEVATTYLHEIGHYLGWNEGEIEDRGLD
jgi:predicted Zn-dependent protease with MMP-like domain